jgi:hypothetical protein
MHNEVGFGQGLIHKGLGLGGCRGVWVSLCMRSRVHYTSNIKPPFSASQQ